MRACESESEDRAAAGRAPSGRRGLARWLAALLALLGGTALGGCDAALDTRTALLVQTLVDADRDLAASRPELVAGKYQEMAAGLHPFLRGTATVFYRDLSRYQDSQAALPHGDGAEQEARRAPAEGEAGPEGNACRRQPPVASPRSAPATASLLSTRRASPAAGGRRWKAARFLFAGYRRKKAVA